MTMSNKQIKQTMKAAARAGFDPYNSSEVFGRMFEEMARRYWGPRYR
jgi:hypothetical protein